MSTMETMAGKKPRRRRSFTPEFKAEVVALVRQPGKTAGGVARGDGPDRDGRAGVGTAGRAGPAAQGAAGDARGARHPQAGSGFYVESAVMRNPTGSVVDGAGQGRRS